MFKWLKNLAKEAAAEALAESGKTAAPAVETTSETTTEYAEESATSRPPKLRGKDFSQARKLRRKYLDDIEKIMNDLPSGTRIEGAAIVKMRTGEVKLHTVSSKAEALDLVQKARKNELLIIM